MANFIGIDLGTTYSLLSSFSEDGSHEIKYDRERFLPSVVYFGDSIAVGETALQALEIDSENVVLQIKKKMPQNNTYELNFNGVKYSPEDISSLILRKLIVDAETKIGKVTYATITTPAFYNDIAREATKKAALKAGIENVSIISEPVAAGLYYSRTKKINGKVLVYDLGGGTLDCSIIDIDGDKVEVQGSRGDSFGGTDFDSKLFDLINLEYKKNKGTDVSSNLANFKKTLQLRIEGYKKTLDFESSVKAVVTGDSGPANIIINTSDFKESLEEYIVKSEMILESLLDELDLTIEKIDEIVLVGGSTRMPLFQDHLKDFFKKSELVSTVNVDEVVCLGASIHCSITNSEKLNSIQNEAVGGIKLSNVVNHFYGTISLDENHQLMNSVMIKKNERFPIEISKTFYTVSGSDSLNCRVTQSEVETIDLEPQEVISESTLEDLGENRVAGEPIEITFTIDNDQILICTFKDPKTGKNVTLEKNLKK